MGSIVLRYILKHIRYGVKKNRSVETTAANNGQKKKLALKLTRTMQTDKTGVLRGRSHIASFARLSSLFQM